jgi:hypothetical protein
MTRNRRFYQGMIPKEVALRRKRDPAGDLNLISLDSFVVSDSKSTPDGKNEQPGGAM